MVPKVYFSKKFDDGSIVKLFNKVYNILKDKITSKERVAIKVHFGEKGNTKFVSPKYIRPMVDCLRKINNNFFITDANTLYKGMRVNATDHKQIAKEHGFYGLGSEVIIADGEFGDYEEKVKINGDIFSEVKIAKHIADSDAIIAISHFKGHILTGFSGSIKNLGMGCGSRAGKLKMHAELKPTIRQDRCITCGACIENCPAKAIKIIYSRVSIDSDLCIGCAKCVAVCKNKAVWSPYVKGYELQERFTEYALGAVKNKKCMYFNFINNVTRLCDCSEDSEIISEDIGITASTDPVACDKAAYDLVIKKYGKDIFNEANKNDGTHSLEYGEKIGLGNKDYELIEL